MGDIFPDGDDRLEMAPTPGFSDEDMWLHLSCCGTVIFWCHACAYDRDCVRCLQLAEESPTHEPFHFIGELGTCVCEVTQSKTNV